MVVIVNWNSKADTLECVQSLQSAGAALDQITVVDNGSSDDSITALQAEFGPELRQVEVGSNSGFAAGTNVGIRLALAENREWLLLINNDTIVHPDFLTQLAAVRDHGFDVLAPLIYYYDRPDRIWYLADKARFAGLMTVNPFEGRTLAELDLPPAPFPIEFVCGTAMLVRAQVFEKVGLFDESLFMYAEEVDFTLRARQAGYKFAAEPRAIMWHRVSASANRVKAQTRYLRIRNQIWIYRRHSQGLITWTLFVLTSARTLFIAIADLIDGRLNLIIPSGRGWLHGWTQPLQGPVY